MDSVFYIERSTGNVLWKMGGASSSRDNAAYVPVADPFFRPSDARLLPGWSTCAGGQVSLFDGEAGKPGPARAVVYDVRVATESGSCDGGSAGATLAWQYKGAVHSLAEGSLRILADGSRTIGWGIKSEPGPGLVFTEVDVSGHDLLDFYFTSGESSSRAIKVPLTALDLSVMRATAGHP
jgi:hypothetical protein